MPNSTKRNAVVAMLLTAAGAHAEALDPRALVGLKYPPLPDSVVKLESFLTQQADDYTVAVIRVGEESALWLAHSNGEGEAREYDVRAVQPLPLLDSGQAIVTIDCELAGNADPDIVAIGSWDGAGKFTAITHAWRPDLRQESFETLPIEQVSCGAGGRREPGGQDSPVIQDSQDKQDSEETR